MSLIKKWFSKDNQCLNIVKTKKWNVNHIKVYIAPIKMRSKVEENSKYRNMVIQAFNAWSLACGRKLQFEITDRLFDSLININWKKSNSKNFGSCYFSWDKQGRLCGAEISIDLFPTRINEIDCDTEIYHSILHCVGISLGVPQTNNPDDIMCIPHQYGKMELSENDKKAICNLYNPENINIANQEQLNNIGTKPEVSDNIKDLRKKEDEEIVEHLKAIYDIANTKCTRCNNLYGCMGCTLSHGDGLRGYINESIKIMMKQSSEARAKIEELFTEK